MGKEIDSQQSPGKKGSGEPGKKKKKKKKRTHQRTPEEQPTAVRQVKSIETAEAITAVYFVTFPKSNFFFSRHFM